MAERDLQAEAIAQIKNRAAGMGLTILAELLGVSSSAVHAALAGCDRVTPFRLGVHLAYRMKAAAAVGDESDEEAVLRLVADMGDTGITREELSIRLKMGRTMTQRRLTALMDKGAIKKTRGYFGGVHYVLCHRPEPLPARYQPDWTPLRPQTRAQMGRVDENGRAIGPPRV